MCSLYEDTENAEALKNNTDASNYIYIFLPASACMNNKSAASIQDTSHERLHDETQTNAPLTKQYNINSGDKKAYTSASQGGINMTSELPAARVRTHVSAYNMYFITDVASAVTNTSDNLK